MNKSLFTLPLSMVLLLSGAAVVAQEKGDEPKQKPVLCAVVQVDNEYRIVKKDEVAALKQQLKDEHKAAVAAHKEEVKAAKARKEKGKIPAPKAKKLKVIKGAVAEEAARELVEKLEAQAAKKAAGKGSKAKPEKKPKKSKSGGE